MRGVEQIPWVYDAFMALNDRLGLDRWRRWLTGGAQGRTLEVGCGTGRNLPLYAQEVTLVACEPAPDTLARARKRAPHALLVRATAEALPFRPGAFDTVVSSLVFCSVPDAKKGLAEVKRVMKPGGQLRMMEHVRAEGFWGRFQDWYQPAWTRVAGGCHPNRQTERTVEESGFSIEPDGRRANGNMRRFSARAR